MSAFAYVVRCSFEAPDVREAFVDWLQTAHVADVCASGALEGEIVRLDAPLAVEVRYRFASREAYEAYERDHAPARRAEGLAVLARLGVAPERGVAFARWTGPIVPVTARRNV